MTLFTPFTLHAGKQKACAGRTLMMPDLDYGSGEVRRPASRLPGHFVGKRKTNAINQSGLPTYEILIIQLKVFSSPTNLIFSKVIEIEQLSESTL